LIIASSRSLDFEFASMAQVYSSHGASNVGLRLIQRSHLTFNLLVAAQEGGSGVVHQAILDGDLVAVKTSKTKGPLNKRDFDRFIQESRIAARVRHQNCVALVAVCAESSDPMLVMEWVGGGNVYNALANNPPPPHVRLRIAREIAGAVDYLHRCRIVHGDLKSLNVLLTSDYSAKVCDFGSATQKLHTTSSIGSSKAPDFGNQSTVPWSSPEILDCQPANCESDIYALGIILWELSTCEAPFHNQNPKLLATLISRGLKPDIPSPLPPGFPPAFFEMMQRCWTEPRLRPTAHELFEYLIKIDPTSRPSAPLLLFPAGHAVLHRSLFDCIRPAMPSTPDVDDLLRIMISQAEQTCRTSLEVQSMCAQCGLLPLEAQALMVRISLFHVSGRCWF
jgi:serine/threonine protein kinase